MSKASPFIDRFLSGMETSGRALYNQSVGYVRGMDTDEDGHLIRTTGNVDRIGEVSATFSEFLTSPTYLARQRELLDATEAVFAEVTGGFISKFGSIPAPLVEEAANVTAVARYALEGTLQGEQVEFATVVPTVNDLFYRMGAGQDVETVIRNYRDIETIFARYFHTQVVFILERMERQIIQLYSRYYGVQRWRYVGPEDEKNRDFCADRVGGEYTEEEIQAWAEEDWDGKIPSTTAQTMFTNLGGFNCRHVLEPI